jgi:hypothetical protein
MAPAELQSVWQELLLQVEVAPVTLVVQAWPQAPQLAESDCTLVHAEPHSVCDGVVVGHVHAPEWQPATDGHFMPHAPQFASSVCVFVHAPLHSVRSAAQPHVPPLQTSVAAHALPHAPQLAESLERLLHVPLQLVWPAGQPVVHAAGAPLACAHAGLAPLQPAPHAPQLVAVDRAVVHPAPASAQSPKPDAHW